MVLPFQKSVTLIKQPGSEQETRITVQGAVQPDKGFFPLTTQVEVGDAIELADPRGGVRRLVVAAVTIHEFGTSLDHLEVVWGEPPVERKAAIRRLGPEGLHPAVLEAAGALFTDGHYSDAIFAAFRAVEARVREMSHLELTGQKLMSEAFSVSAPKISVATEPGLLGNDEQRGFMYLFMGAMVGIRNPKGHGLVAQQDPQRALEYLAFASVLMRRLDDATQ